MNAATPEMVQAVRQLVDEYRDQCLWFLRRDYYPGGPDQMVRILEYIERHGDQRGYRRAAEMKRWLLRHSSAASASS
jgi:hypothetical protein